MRKYVCAGGIKFAIKHKWNIKFEIFALDFNSTALVFAFGWIYTSQHLAIGKWKQIIYS